MRKVISIVLFALFFLGCTTGQKPKENIIKTVKKQNDFAIIIHGGAGTILKKNMTKEREAAYKEKLAAAIKVGHTILKNGGTSLSGFKNHSSDGSISPF